MYIHDVLVTTCIYTYACQCEYDRLMYIHVAHVQEIHDCVYKCAVDQIRISSIVLSMPFCWPTELPRWPSG